MTKGLEAQREAGRMGSVLQAAVDIRCDGERFVALASLDDDLKFVLICSSTVVSKDENEQVVATPLDAAPADEVATVISSLRVEQLIA